MMTSRVVIEAETPLPLLNCLYLSSTVTLLEILYSSASSDSAVVV